MEFVLCEKIEASKAQNATLQGASFGRGAVCCAAAGQQQPHALQQVRDYTPPSKRTWAKQNEKIHTRRPLTESFAMHKVHPTLEWWREKRSKPATFMGFPDPLLHSLRGGSLYIEQMDAVTLACVSLRLLSAGPDVRDDASVLTLKGALLAKLGKCELMDVAAVVEALANPFFASPRQGLTDAALSHLELLLQHREDFDSEELAAALCALVKLGANEPQLLFSERLVACDLESFEPLQLVAIIEALCMAYPVLSTCVQSQRPEELLLKSVSSSGGSNLAELTAHLKKPSPVAYALSESPQTPYNTPISYRPPPPPEQQPLDKAEELLPEQQPLHKAAESASPSSCPLFVSWLPALLNALLRKAPAGVFTAAEAATALSELSAEALKSHEASPTAADAAVCQKQSMHVDSAIATRRAAIAAAVTATLRGPLKRHTATERL
ncbi:uncharacterized protein LOC34624404 [Cyclospora cayetanensis]|uniref:Uncharacterized protein LOC34624404 n=1 Tax=Cyclospora cayetanensis TaxID=88456 RepID=A0A6P6RUK6_9EIME|nr:uncharacterized protein LOC34624404 [Cyclospora cayetanensis]